MACREAARALGTADRCRCGSASWPSASEAPAGAPAQEAPGPTAAPAAAPHPATSTPAARTAREIELEDRLRQMEDRLRRMPDPDEVRRLQGAGAWDDCDDRPPASLLQSRSESARSWVRTAGSAPVGFADPPAAGEHQRAAVLPIVVHDGDPGVGLRRVGEELLALLVALPIKELVGQRLAVGRPAEVIGRGVVLILEDLAPAGAVDVDDPQAIRCRAPGAGRRSAGCRARSGDTRSGPDPRSAGAGRCRRDA